MVRADLVRRKVAKATGWLDSIEAMLAEPIEEFLAEPRLHDLTSFYLFLAIQECLDMAAHWVSDAGWTQPAFPAAAFDVLAEKAAIDVQLASELRTATGLRNRIAHGYGGIDHRRLWQEAQNGLAVLRAFLVKAMEATGKEE